VRVEVEELGRGGDTVVLVHGLAVDGALLRDTVAILAERRRVVLPDLRGHGRSPAEPPEALEDYARDLVPLLEAHAPAALVGLSFGSIVVSDLWRLLPEAVTSVVLFDPALELGPLLAWAETESKRRGIAVEEAALEPYLVRDERTLLEALARHPLSSELEGPGLRRLAEAMLACDGETLRATLPLLRAAPAPARPPGTTARLTLLRARDGILCPAATAVAFAGREHAHVVELPCGHQAPLTAPVLLGRAIEHALG
jgi:pimeloyl-ACP methyl ester carboxylesterase